jgi:Transposase IS116/IS110/IS902 family
LLATHWPALERAFGERLGTPGGLALLRAYPSSPALHRAGPRRVERLLREQRVRQPEAWAEHLVAAAGAQTVAVPGAETAARLIAELAAQLTQLLARRGRLEREIERAFFALPEAAILLSLPGIGPRLGARIVVEIGAVARFPTPAHLAAFASPRHPPSRAYYDRKRAEGKRHNQAVLCLARRRVDVLHAMLSHGALYQPPAPSLPLAA